MRSRWAAMRWREKRGAGLLMAALVNLWALRHKAFGGIGAMDGDEIAEGRGGRGAKLAVQRAVQRAGWGLRFAARYAVDLALPPRCPACGLVVRGDHQLCLTCWQSLDFLDGPACARCSMPFAAGQAFVQMECGGCLAEPPDFEGALAAVAYGDVARRVALRLKHGRRMGDAKLMAGLMARQVRRLVEHGGGDSGGGAALLVPVPLHRWRLWARGYNQSGLMAQHIGQICGLDVDMRLLARIKQTPVLRGKGRAERRDIVKNAFAVVDGRGADRGGDWRADWRGRHIILIDDVHASGATLRACAKVLKRAGAARVSAVTWARVVPSAIMTSNLFDFAAWDSDMGEKALK